MEKIKSFTVDHIRLVPGLYVSRIDYVNQNPVTTFDIRMTSPNDGNEYCRGTYYRTSGRYVSSQSRNLGGQNDLFRPHGMPHRFLSDPFRRIYVPGYCAPDD